MSDLETEVGVDPNSWSYRLGRWWRLHPRGRWVAVGAVALLLIAALGTSGTPNKPSDTIEMPTSSIDLKGENYKDVLTKLKTAGFASVETTSMDDLVLGWLTKDGEVERVSVDGETEFDVDSRFPKGARIVITYHTFPKEEPENAAESDSVENETPESATEEVDDRVRTSQTDAAELKIAAQRLESTFPVEKARRAAVVALTNALAVDVISSDGNSYDVSKFHSYADTSGDPDKYFLNVSSWGTWSAKDERTWHVDSLLLEHGRTHFDASLDVGLKGTNFVVSNVTGTRGPAGYPDELYVDNGPHSSVPAKLVRDNRKQSNVDALDHSGDLDKFAARAAFEKYGKTAYAYGFKCAWTLGLINEEQRSDGSWFFKVDAKITNEYGATRGAVAEGVVSGTTASPTVKDFGAN